MKGPAREYEWRVEEFPRWYQRVDSKKEQGMLIGDVEGALLVGEEAHMGKSRAPSGIERQSVWNKGVGEKR